MKIIEQTKTSINPFPSEKVLRFLLFNLDFDDSYIEKYKRGKRESF
jgi:hypothetical protein